MNASKNIFIVGEFMFLIEADKRGQENAVSLTYSSSEGLQCAHLRQYQQLSG
jgi:hypothetical protein